MRRRQFLETAALTALAGLGTGCATRKTSASAPPPLRATRTPLALAVPRISWERVIRTTVGLRPSRASGFVLKAEKFDTKTVIHDYGFGGAGMSLAWGCGVMVAELALEHQDRRVAVLGCGSPGVTAARQLQRRGFDVTIYAMTVPPDTTSNMSMAGFTPTTALIDNDKRTPAWDAMFVRAAEMSYRELQLLAGSPGYGVSWVDSYNATENPPGNGGGGGGSTLVPEHLRPNRDREVLGPGEHPFPTKYAVRTSALAIQPNAYMDALVRDFLLFGGKIVIRKFDTPRDLMSLPESIVVNATGLGSKTLFNDDELVPIKGQFTVCIPQPEVNYRVSGRLPNSTLTGNGGINPRSDGILVGNMMERGNWSLEPNEEVRQRNIDTAIEFFNAMRTPAPGLQLSKSVPPTRLPALESFYGLES